MSEPATEAYLTRSRPSTIAAFIFLLFAPIHLFRRYSRFQVVTGSHVIPTCVSWVAILVGLILALGLYRESRS